MRKSVVALLCTTMLWLMPSQAMEDPYVGYFVSDLEGRHYRVNIERVNASNYDGILQIDGEPMQLDARRYGERMNGLLRNHGEEFGFRARFEGGILLMQTDDGRRIIFRSSRPE